MYVCLARMPTMLGVLDAISVPGVWRQGCMVPCGLATRWLGVSYESWLIVVVSVVAVRMVYIEFHIVLNHSFTDLVEFGNMQLANSNNSKVYEVDPELTEVLLDPFMRECFGPKAYASNPGAVLLKDLHSQDVLAYAEMLRSFEWVGQW